jgi:hypothetical protein
LNHLLIKINYPKKFIPVPGQPTRTWFSYNATLSPKPFIVGSGYINRVNPEDNSTKCNSGEPSPTVIF